MVECECENVDTWIIEQTPDGEIEMCVICFFIDRYEQTLSRASTPEINA